MDMARSSGREFRYDPLYRKWVIVAPDRGSRPDDFNESGRKKKDAPDHDPDCPFCPGNDDRLEDIVEEVEGLGGGWRTRAVLNRYPVLAPGHPSEERRVGPYRSVKGRGRHEVIIESPLHNQDLPDMDQTQLSVLVGTWQNRVEKLTREHGLGYATLFRNHGPGAGTSLRHPHSQVVGTPWVPDREQTCRDAALEHHDRTGSCLVCELQAFEQGEGERMVAGNEGFQAWVPFSAGAPGEMRIAPVAHMAAFHSMDSEARELLARLLGTCLDRLRRWGSDPDYNLALHTAVAGEEDAPHIHWFFTVRPRFGTPAGFEMGSGMAVNASIPERDASELRDAGC